MGRNTENNSASALYGRNATVTTTTVNGTTTTCSSEKLGTRVVRGNGTINSRGVTPDGSVCSMIGSQTEVEFTLDIYKKGNSYQGDLYMVSYDTRKKISSNRLIYYQRVADEEALCIFCVQYLNGCTTCTYELFVSISPTNCLTCSAGECYAYSAPIYNEGVNIGGNLKTGEIIFYSVSNADSDESSNCSQCCNCTSSSNNTVTSNNTSTNTSTNNSSNTANASATSTTSTRSNRIQFRY